MTTSEPHPSYLELDRLALARPTSLATARHVADCPRCRAHLDSVGQVPPLPAGLRERALAEARAGGIAGLFRRLAAFAPPPRRLFGALGAFALAATLLLLLPHHPRIADAPRPAGYEGSKGLPSVWIYLKHDGELTLWDGRRRLAPGDRLRLKVDPQDHTHVQLFTRESSEDSDAAGGRPGRPLSRVFSGALEPGVVTTLPAAWQLDGSGHPQALIVVLAKRPVSEAEARRFVDSGAPVEVWLRTFELRPIATNASPAGNAP